MRECSYGVGHRLAVALCSALFLGGAPLAGWADSGAASTVPLAGILDLFEQRRLPFERDRVLTAAAEAMLRTIDPRARLLPEGDRSMAPTGRTVVCAAAWQDRLACVRLARVDDDSSEEAVTAVRTVLEHGAAGLILDLRGCGGDGLAACGALVGLFTGPDIELLLREGCGEGETNVVRSSGAALPDLPDVAMLIDRRTSSVGEAFAAVMRALPKVIAVGEATAGDARVRERLKVDSAWSVYVATASLVPVSGAPFAGKGVLPDIVVAPSPGQDLSAPVLDGDAVTRLFESDGSLRVLLEEVSADPCLARAVDILLGAQALAGSGVISTNAPRVSPDSAPAADTGDEIAPPATEDFK